MSTNPTKKTEAIATLTLARDLLAKPHAWTKGTYARDKQGYPVAEYEVSAASWCMIGAVKVVTHCHVAREARAIAALARITEPLQIHHFNDGATCCKADVLAAFDLAIELVREEA